LCTAHDGIYFVSKLSVIVKSYNTADGVQKRRGEKSIRKKGREGRRGGNDWEI
jgi:hypothetical protein